MSKKITVTAKEVVTNVRDGSKTVEAPQRYIEVELRGLGEDHLLDPSLFKYNEDIPQIREVFSRFFGRPLADLSSATEILYINAAKVFAESQTASDNLLLSADWIRETSDTSATSDSVTLLVDFRPVIQDWVHMTDGVLGIVEDDQNKIVAELRTVGEELSSALDKLTSDDAWSINDIAIKSVDMPLKDFLGVPDVLGKSLAASKADATVMSDACTANLQDYMSALYVNVGYIGFNYTL